MIAASTIDAVRERADILQVIGDAVPSLKRRGRSYVGLCPFHRERSPSFHVNADRGFFHCFGCQESGSTIDFIMKLEGATFPEAVRSLAERFNIQIEEDTRDQNSKDQERHKKTKEECFAANEVAARFFEEQMASHALREYAVREIEKRGLSLDNEQHREVLSAFRVGYAPNGWDELAQALKKNGVSPTAGESVGLIVPRSSGSGYYDRFRHRLMFAVVDVQGRVVAFSGRALEPVPGSEKPGADKADKPAKYINSPESPIYVKGSSLFGVAQAKQAIRAEGTVVVVEGNFDVVSLHARGIRHVVAPLGTAFTIEQARLLKRFAQDVVLLFDADAAGQKATRAARAPLREAGIRAKVATLPAGKDPDELARTHGIERVNDIVKTARGMLEYLIDDALSDGMSGASLIEKVARVTEVAQLIRDEEDPLVQSLAKSYADDLSGRLDIHGVSAFQALEQTLKRALEQERKTQGPDPKRARVKARPRGYEERKAIVEVLVEWPQLFTDDEVRDVLAHLEGMSVDIVLALQKAYVAEKNFLDLDVLFQGLQEPKVIDFVRKALSRGQFFEIDQAKSHLLDNGKRLKRLLLASEASELAKENYGSAANWEEDTLRVREALSRVRAMHGVREPVKTAAPEAGEEDVDSM